MPRFQGILVDAPRFAGTPVEPKVGRVQSAGESLADPAAYRRAFGVAARGALEGIAGAPDIVTAPFRALGAASRPESVLRPLAAIPESRGAMAQLLTQLGLPVAETQAERFTEAIYGAATPAGAQVGGAQALARGAPLAAQRIAQILAQQPGRQLAGATGGALGAQTAQEAGLGPTGQIAAGLVGGLAGGAALPSRLTPEAQRAAQTAQRLGVQLTGEPGAQVQQVRRAAERMTPAERGEALPAVRQSVLAERKVARKQAGELFEEAKKRRAFVPMAEVRGLAQEARQALTGTGFDLQMMPGVSRRLAELDQVAQIGGGRAANLKALEQWRKRITAMTPRDGSPEQAAATALKRHYDRWIERQFNDDMIYGDPGAVDAWRQARGAWAHMKDKFDANEVLRKFQRENLTQEQMRGWIFNANIVGARREAGEVVRRLNNILGKDSPEMGSLRSEAMLDIAEPLFRETPDVAKFLSNYDKFLANNPTLRRELFPSGLKDFDNLAKFARAIAKRPGAKISKEQAEGIWSRTLNGLIRYMVGHDIAQSAVRVQTAQGLTELARQKTIGAMARKDLLRQYIGSDPTLPVFEPAARGAAFGAAQQENE